MRNKSVVFCSLPEANPVCADAAKGIDRERAASSKEALHSDEIFSQAFSTRFDTQGTVARCYCQVDCRDDGSAKSLQAIASHVFDVVGLLSSYSSPPKYISECVSIQAGLSLVVAWLVPPLRQFQTQTRFSRCICVWHPDLYGYWQ